MLPDVQVNILSAATPRTIPTDTGQAFACGVTQRGSSAQPLLCRSIQDFINAFGQRLNASPMYDWVETFFGEGGTKLYVSRVFGSGAAQATLNLMDSAGTPAVSLIVKAAYRGDADPGTWANGSAGGLSVAVVANGSQYQLQIFQNNVIVESSPLLTTQQDAINWSNDPNLGSQFISCSLGVSTLVPAVAAAANLAGGSDGSAVASPDRQAALDRIPQLLGPGQICAPGVTSSADQLAVIAHGLVNNRWPLLDAPDTWTAATLISAAAALYGAPAAAGQSIPGRCWGQLLAPWDVIPGLTAYTTRVVPPSARQAAQYARVDALGNPNQAAAGDFGTAQFVQDLSQPKWDAPTRLSLNTAGVTVSRRRYAGAIVTYGFRTLADQQQQQNWSMAPNVRTVMAYVAQAYAIGEHFEFRQVDGFNHTLSEFKGALTAPAKVLYDLGALFPSSPDAPSTAFLIDTSPALNPPAQLAAGKMQASVKLRTSPGAEAVVINVTKVPITQAI